MNVFTTVFKYYFKNIEFIVNLVVRYSLSVLLKFHDSSCYCKIIISTYLTITSDLNN